MLFPKRKAVAEAVVAEAREPELTVQATAKPEPAKQKAKGKPVNPDDDLSIGKWYLAQAKELEKNSRDGERKLAKVAIAFAVGALFVAAIAIIGAILLAVLKRPNPPAVLFGDTNTGTVRVLPTTADGRVTWTEKNLRASLRQYVEARESYDWETINDMHGFVMLESDGAEQARYDAWIRGPRGPLVLDKDQYREIATVNAITFVGDTAQVFFSKRIVPVSPGAVPKPTEFWVATVATKYVNVPEVSDDQDLDPTGFRVVSYTRDQDWTHASTAGAK
jgi:type IV secretion system protein VirB8